MSSTRKRLRKLGSLQGMDADIDFHDAPEPANGSLIPTDVLSVIRDFSSLKNATMLKLTSRASRKSLSTFFDIVDLDDCTICGDSFPRALGSFDSYRCLKARMSTKEDADAVLDAILRSQVEILDLTFELEDSSSDDSERSQIGDWYGNRAKRSLALEQFEEEFDGFQDHVLEKLRVFHWNPEESSCDVELPIKFLGPSLEKIAVTINYDSANRSQDRVIRSDLFSAIRRTSPNVKYLTVIENGNYTSGAHLDLLEAVPDLKNLQHLALKNKSLSTVIKAPVEVSLLAQHKKIGQFSPLWLSVPEDFSDIYTLFHSAISSQSKSGVSKLLKAVSTNIDFYDFEISHALLLLKDLKATETIVDFTKIIVASGFDVGARVPFGRRLPRWQYLLCICPTVDMFKLLFEWELQVAHACATSAVAAAIRRHSFLPSSESLITLLSSVSKPSPIELMEYLIQNKQTIESAFGKDLVGLPTDLSGGSHSLLHSDNSPAVTKWLLSQNVNPNIVGTMSSLPFTLSCFSHPKLLKVLIENPSTDLSVSFNGRNFAQLVLESPNIPESTIASLLKRDVALPQNSLYVARCASRFLEQDLGVDKETTGSTKWRTIERLLSHLSRSTAERLVAEALLQWVQLDDLRRYYALVSMESILEYCSGSTLQQLEERLACIGA